MCPFEIAAVRLMKATSRRSPEKSRKIMPCPPSLPNSTASGNCRHWPFRRTALLFRHANRITASASLAKARPDHQQLAVLGSMQERAVCDERRQPALERSHPWRFRGPEQQDRLAFSRGPIVCHLHRTNRPVLLTEVHSLQ